MPDHITYDEACEERSFGEDPYYQMDDATFDHLSDWCERNVRAEDEDRIRNLMVESLELLEHEDAAYTMSHGWSHVYSLAVN